MTVTVTTSKTDSESEETPCSACSWTPTRQKYCHYKSNIQIFYEASDRGAWSLGTKYILKDRGTSPPIHEAVNTTFIQQNTTIPVPNILQEWTENGRHMTIAERVPGRTLEVLWPEMSETQREDLARETMGYLDQLRNLTCDKMQGLDGVPLHNAFLFSGSYGTTHGPFSSDEELWEALSADFEDTPDEVVSLVKRRMPSGFPWTFTHGDLTVCNIMVDSETYRLTGIIDWEGSGYFPVWWGYVGAIGLSDDDAKWKRLLRRYMPDYSTAREFYLDVCACRDRRPEGSNSERRARLWKEAGLGKSS